MQPTDWPHAPPHRLGSNHPYFVTAATYRKQHFFNTPERLDVLQRGLLKLSREYGWRLEAWAIFSNHYHFIARPPAEATTLRRLLTTLHSKTARWLNKLDAAPARRVWHNYRDTILSFENSYRARLNYVHQNPVRHGLVPVADDYRWCSMAWFRRAAPASLVRTIESFKTDRVKVPDDFSPIPPEE